MLWAALLLLLVAAVRAQRPPPFSVPEVVPQDLQIDGEWWFYSLLDSQFPHDVLTPLPESAVAVSDAARGTPAFAELPNAQYVLLEFFAPWCPHCQHFAPEMVKLVTALKGLRGAGGAPAVAVRTVDCERLGMTALCNWADANMMPRLVFASRDALAAPLSPLAARTPGVRELFPVDSARQALAWLQQQAPELPRSLPLPEPVDQNAPFFGWSQPPEGVTEPAYAPAQDLEVAVVSLLHEAFSSLDFTPERRRALFELLELLCFAGPGGGACRQSACRMRAGLEQSWSAWIREVTVTRTAQGDPMPPTTFHYLDWAAVEQEHRWCGRPWPDFAGEGWSWCRGRTPGTRGFTCGLWLLFHGLLAGAAAAQEAQRPAPPKAPLEVVRGTVGAFFGCADCRKHFLAVPVSGEDLASPKAQALWLWGAHNLATERIAREEAEHSASAPPRRQWPSPAACPRCRAADGRTWDVDAVYEHLRAFYGPAFALHEGPGGGGQPAAAAPQPSGFIGKRLVSEYEEYERQQLPGGAARTMRRLPPSPTREDAKRVSVEVYYYTLCPHCESFLRLGLLPLVEAQLPGSQVQITILPIYPPLLQWVRERRECLAREDCLTALAPLCALKAAPKPAPADSPALLTGSRFAACDISYTATGRGRDPAATKGCAEAAGLSWHDLESCAGGAESSALLQRGSNHLMTAMGLLHDKTGFQDPPSMPWVFLNGDLLLCENGTACTAIQTPAGDRPLPASASLLSLVCSHLDPLPGGCGRAEALVKAVADRTSEDAPARDAGRRPPAERASAQRAEECESCVEVGTFRWSRSRSRGPEGVSAPPLAAAAIVVLAVVALWRIPRQLPLLRGGQRAEEATHEPMPGGRDEALWRIPWQLLCGGSRAEEAMHMPLPVGRDEEERSDYHEAYAAGIE